MHRRNAWLRAALLSGAIAGCARLPWPEEPGVPVAMGRATTVQADDVFLAKLRAERRAANLPAPIVTPRYQDGMRVVADDLQAGKLNAAEAARASERWGKAAYQRPVAVWLVDCAAGNGMKLPGALVNRPEAVVSFATAYFRPRSMASDQCAVLVVAVEGPAPAGY